MMFLYEERELPGKTYSTLHLPHTAQQKALPKARPGKQVSRSGRAEHRPHEASQQPLEGALYLDCFE